MNRKQFIREIKAIELAIPLALAARFDDISHCIETSVSGAEALRRRGIEATAIPCAIAGWDEGLDISVAIGLTERDFYDLLDDPQESFEDWSATAFTPKTQDPCGHMVIEACYDKHRAVVDGTLGQLRQFGINVPMSHATFGLDWGGVVSKSWELHYFDSPRAQVMKDVAADLLRQASEPVYEFATDICGFMDVALRCELNASHFYSTVSKEHPKLFKHLLNMSLVKKR